jgi:LytS/YehU family sensor histidine kinase
MPLLQILLNENTSDYPWDIIVTLVIAIVWVVWKLRKERKERELISKENARLVAQNAVLEAEQLKFQLQPHTLNNLLANLRLIASKLNRGLNSFSETLEYILYKGKSNLVSVKDEIEFINTYIALNELFINEIDAIIVKDTEVDKNSKFYNASCIPHLITAYFIENAFKHGDTAHPEFLRITLKLSHTSFEMTVTNQIKKKPINTSGGIGLKNMKNRLDLFLAGKYEIRNSCNEHLYLSTLIIRF